MQLSMRSVFFDLIDNKNLTTEKDFLDKITAILGNIDTINF
ncbi:hypothetical protein PCH70_03270 [Pseudomonas cichorii JBC1]|nr:hypothetical protein PCH70_03270 [Pseudomonas cichorii JBC1]